MIHNDLDLCHVQNHIVYRYAFDIMMEMCGQFFHQNCKQIRPQHQYTKAEP